MNAALFDSVIFALPHGNEKEELLTLCNTYPYFAAAQYILLKKETAETEQWFTQGKKAALLFSPQLLIKTGGNVVKEETLKTIEPEVISLEAQDETSKQEEKEYNSTDIPLNNSNENPSAIASEPISENIDEEVPANSSTDIDESTVPLSLPPLSIKPFEEEQLLFEPLHTSDYFASQGIKISHVANPTDKLGKQLKSFTGWLQTMKQVHPQKSISISMDKNVEALAEKSNREDDVLTEAMAEACLHQGKNEKAREIYEKLSLLNPAKSSYFAAKINELQ